MRMRGRMDPEALVRLVLVMVVVWLALEVVGVAAGSVGATLAPFRPLVGFATLAVLTLWLLRRL
jgi:hypothetical protein